MYRDEQEALRVRVGTLESQVAQLRKERDQARKERSEARMEAARWKGFVDEATIRETRRQEEEEKRLQRKAEKRARKLAKKALTETPSSSKNGPRGAGFMALVFGAPFGILVGSMGAALSGKPGLILFGGLVGMLMVGSWALGR